MQLSVKFHPDKQLDPAKKEAATRQFFEIQKAYEGNYLIHRMYCSTPDRFLTVLSDSLRR